MRRLATLAAVSLCLVACQKPFEERVAGNWKGPNNSTFTIEKEKTYKVAISAMGQNISLVGDWTATGEKITLTPKTVNGQPVAQLMTMISAVKLSKEQKAQVEAGFKPMVYSLAGDGKTLTSEGTPKAITLTKE